MKQNNKLISETEECFRTYVWRTEAVDRDDGSLFLVC